MKRLILAIAVIAAVGGAFKTAHKEAVEQRWREHSFGSVRHRAEIGKELGEKQTFRSADSAGGWLCARDLFTDQSGKSMTLGVSVHRRRAR